MFTNCRHRGYRTFTYQPVDRVPDFEFGFWPQTIRRWAGEGFPAEWAQEIGDAMFHPRFEQFIGTDYGEEQVWETGLGIHTGMNPPFELQVLEEDEKTQLVRDETGVVARRWKGQSDESSIPEYLAFPVTDRKSWEAIKARYRPDDPIRRVDPADIDKARQKAGDGWAVNAGTIGFYGQMRYWVGVENLSYLIHDEPELVREMAWFWAELILAGLRQIPADVPIHQFGWWEDMCYNHGPLISPATFEEVLIPCYQAVLAEAAKHGCELSIVDCDGLIHALTPLWLKAGVNIMFPNEVAAGTDIAALRRQLGPAVRFQGGIDKRALAQGRSAIDRELDRIAPFLEAGGYVPTLDHLVPPDIGLSDYMYYRERKRQLIGKR